MSKANSIALGVNVDHVATLRQARATRYPDPVDAALLAERAGADSITIHVREDRRHIQVRDLQVMTGVLQTHINLEMAVTDAMIGIALASVPSDCCLVPESRQELTTEGGLDVVTHGEKITDACAQLAAKGIRVSLFIDPEERQLDAAVACGAAVVELHTGTYADASTSQDRATELGRIRVAAERGAALGLTVHAGHGLHYHNVQAVAAIPEIVELNIGHGIVARAVFDGLGKAVSDMKQLMLEARAQ